MTFNSIIHNDPNIITIGQLLSSSSVYSQLTAKELLNISVDGKTNYSRIQRRYTIKELRDNDNKFASSQFDSIQLKIGSELYIPNEKLVREILHKQEPNVIQITEAKPFLASALNDLMRDPNYTKVDSLKRGLGSIITHHDEMAVYMWVRSMTPYDQQSQGSWLDITPFIENITTDKGPDAGSFSISLAPVLGINDPNKGWVFDAQSLRGFLSNYVTINHISYPSASGDGYNRNTFFFEHALQRNDIVYIRFERLNIDKRAATEFELPPTEVVNSTWDMIGLVDLVMQSISSEQNSLSINVSGRDLTKIVIDDGSYFFPEQFGGYIFSQQGLLANRNKVESALNVLNVYTYKTIEIGLKFIINKFSSIGLVPDSAFVGYGDRVNKTKFSLQESLVKKTVQSDVISLVDPFLNEQRKGVWQIIDIVFDTDSAKRVLADNSVSQEQGSILNSIKKFCQEPFVEFYTDTYGDRFVFVIRKPPFDIKGYRGMVYDDIQTESNSVSKFGGTNPAFDNIQINDRLSNLVIDIDDAEVLQENLQYHDEAYSWYQLTPQGLLRGGSQLTTFAFIPLIPLDEYAEVFGSKPYSIVSNYVPFEYVDDAARKQRQNFVESQAFLDLQYMIQSTQYLPFARKGMLVLTGDRRLKRGLFIRYKPTNEIFHIDSVSHTRSVGIGANDRVTSIAVSRGLREPFIRGVDVQFGSATKKVSYFDIVNTDIGDNPSINNNSFLKNWKVDKDLFNFFLHRRQWDQSYDR